MNILHIVPGSGGHFYCQNCIRDIGLVQALHAAGHSVLFMPLYLPFQDLAQSAVPQSPVFFGAVNLYLSQKLPLFRYLPPRWRQRLDAPGILHRAATRAGTTQAAGLGDLTHDVLLGENGRQRQALDTVTAWLQTQPRFDVVHLSNALLLGLAPTLRRHFGMTVVCSLQDEDTWLDALPPRWRNRCWDRIRALSVEVNLFLPVSHYYAHVIQARLDVPEKKFRVLYPGVDIAHFTPSANRPTTPVIGFLAEPIPENGLAVLIEAFQILKSDPSLGTLRLQITGGNLSAMTPFLRRQQRRIRALGLTDHVTFSNDFRPEHRADFLRSLRALSVPSIRPEAFGLFQIEAMACGIPVVQPRRGAYPEIIEATGGGVLVDDPTPTGLARALFPLMTDANAAARLGQTGREAVTSRFSTAHMAARVAQAYRDATNA